MGGLAMEIKKIARYYNKNTKNTIHILKATIWALKECFNGGTVENLDHDRIKNFNTYIKKKSGVDPEKTKDMKKLSKWYDVYTSTLRLVSKELKGR
jgi:hypothetical protein